MLLGCISWHAIGTSCEGQGQCIWTGRQGYVVNMLLLFFFQLLHSHWLFATSIKLALKIWKSSYGKCTSWCSLGSNPKPLDYKTSLQTTELPHPQGMQYFCMVVEHCANSLVLQGYLRLSLSNQSFCVLLTRRKFTVMSLMVFNGSSFGSVKLRSMYLSDGNKSDLFLVCVRLYQSCLLS